MKWKQHTINCEQLVSTSVNLRFYFNKKIFPEFPHYSINEVTYTKDVSNAFVLSIQ